jgi:hypothetical protein
MWFSVFFRSPGQTAGLTSQTWPKPLPASRHKNDMWDSVPKPSTILVGDWVKGGGGEWCRVVPPS